MNINNLLIEIRTVSNERLGQLSIIEPLVDIDFKINRIYYIYGVPKDEIRGFHAHKKLRQLLFCPYGKIEIIIDNGKEKESVILNSPEKGLIVEEGIWRTMKFIEENSVLCVAASDYYDEDDYIRDYNDFLEKVRSGYWENGCRI